MPVPLTVPEYRAFSPTKRVDVLVADWKASVPPELPPEERERRIYGLALEEYDAGDYAFGAWCWHECDRLSNAFGGRVGEVSRVLGEGRYLGFSHRRAIAERVPMDRLYRPRKGDMSTPRPEAVVLPSYQLTCVYAVRAESGEASAKAQLDIALLELGERRRADPYMAHFETFRRLLERARARSAAPAVPSSPSSPVAPTPEEGNRKGARRRGPR